MDRLGRLAPGVSDAVVVEGLDDFEQTRRVVLEALSANPGTIGIYSAGGFNRAIAKAISQARLAHRVVFVGHELTDGSRNLLHRGRMDLIFDQNPEVQTDRAIQHLLHDTGRLGKRPDDAPVPFTVHGPDNTETVL